MARARLWIKVLAQAAVLGLAIAFVVILVRPELLRPPAPAIVDAPKPAVSPAGPLAGGTPSYAAAVERASAAVVNINTAKVVAVRPHPFFDDPLFREFFGRDNRDLLGPGQRVERSLGSGVITSPEGYVLTNYHVIRGADAIQVSLQDGRTVSARVVGSDPDTDLAVLKIDLKPLPVISVGHSEKLRVGDVVLAIGNPFGVGQTVTMGIVSATGRSRLGISTFENFIQTDAAINPGNSGGALVDVEGNLIGINTAIFSKSGGYQGVGFAIPTSIAQNVLDQIIRHGRPLRGWLGIEAQPLRPDVAEALGLESTAGVVVVAVVRNGPAHRAGIQPGDVIRTIDGREIADARQALLAISGREPGSRVRIGIVREGRTLTLEATAIERPPAAGAS
ncbi:2-alkenal reductase [Sulfurifustis variabilis]|uniref:2-alkenal reductase n=1 Tax=Sulfurifustis variabilis TaxID=1675686 RepID=A0A1B4V3Z3_9GAMM|nr:Do family serine endopeptidase [Sulfurifustis variabilis]BAU47252.1 2-alkenal reductase [Sulfurifustis variabilis]